MNQNNYSVSNANKDEMLMLDLLSTPFESSNTLTCNNTITSEPVKPHKEVEMKSYSLTTKKAIEFLLNGTLKKKVCRYCLKVTSSLSELDQVLHVASGDILYKVTIRDMVASFHPIKVADDPNFPTKICDKCLDNTIRSYLFKQQCERSERALRNCFEDIFDKLEKLDPLERQKRRGRQKSNPNPNVLYSEHYEVIDYAEPLITIVNACAEFISDNPDLSALMCSKCSQVLPNIESLLNHEKSHPKSMWYHCRHCGKSFPKRNHLKKHLQAAHNPGKLVVLKETDFKCQDCGTVSSDYNNHIQHIEKHKFKTIMEHLISKKMDQLCTLCLNKDPKLVDMEQMICIHGGYPEMMGDMTLYNVLGSTIPEMSILRNYTGSNICEKCLNHAITSYVFIHHTKYIRNRLMICINSMLESLNTITEPQENIFIEISQDLIMPKKELFDENLLVENLDDLDETKLHVEVLEDEFRMKLESDEESNDEEHDKSDDSSNIFDVDDYLTNLKPPDKPLKTYSKSNMLNGINSFSKHLINDVCSEFLTFKKRKKPTVSTSPNKFTCLICNKHFISHYFLKRHILKHVLRKADCLICGLSFKSKFYLYEHTKVEHLLKEMNYVSCKTCGRTFPSEIKLYSHEKCHKTKVCNLCNKTFITQKHYESHMQRHIAKLRIIKQKSVQTCSFCEKQCANDNDLSVHVNKVHLQIKPYSCDMCERQFYTESNLNHHKIVHSMPTKETCDFCNKTLKCRKDLVTHVSKHIGSRPYTCQVCEQSFHSQKKLERHLKILHGGKFCCKLCKTVLTTKKQLKEHINGVHNI